MKKIFTLVAIVVVLNISNSYGVKHVVTNVGNTFSPASITINKDDTVDFQIGAIHNVVEVSQTTWNANGNTSNGGFTVPFDGGMHKFTQTGTFYYVCAPHAAGGMKGIITVVESTGIKEKNFSDVSKVFLVPGSNSISITYNLKQPSVMKYSIYKLSGEKVYSKIISKNQIGEVNDVLALERELPMGLYLFEVIINNRKYTRKLFITPLN